MKRNCLICNNEFDVRGTRHIYCGDALKKIGCSYKNFLNWQKERSKTRYTKLPLEKRLDFYYKKYKHNAHKRGLNFEISLDDFKILSLSECYYCGEIKDINGLDRVNNDMHYSKDNTVPCCKTCNFAKHKLCQADFISLARKISKRFPLDINTDSSTI